ncbi:hypothetical protein [Salinispora arenicola]|uniref:hypothetical protein n=1 Tax=Salinispora arenicola TaxID=168697 RepID=UPI00036FC90F|nr:hypothetical protein [Salinispora arenicola]
MDAEPLVDAGVDVPGVEFALGEGGRGDTALMQPGQERLGLGELLGGVGLGGGP